MSAPTFYKKFLLVDTPYTEFHFKDMLEIFNLQGMDQWVEMYINPTKLMKEPEVQPPPICFSLVIFQPPTQAPLSSRQSATERRISAAHAMASEMIRSTFDSKEDHESINESMANFPTMAIFMSQVCKQDKKNKNKPKNQGKSIFDLKDISSRIHCLAAVNYFQDNTYTQVLWLSTTLEAPPIDSLLRT